MKTVLELQVIQARGLCAKLVLPDYRSKTSTLASSRYEALQKPLDFSNIYKGKQKLSLDTFHH